MLENWRNADPVFFTQVGRMGHRPIVATKGGVTIKRDGAILGGLGISGVVDVSGATLEAVEDILARVDPVVDERTEDDVAIATNGGFAQSADHPLMSEEAQNAKLRLAETVARYYWGNEI